MRRLAMLLACLALLSACSASPKGEDVPPEGEYTLWFAQAHPGANSAALGKEFRPLPEDSPTAAEGLLSLLFAGPESEELVSPFPAGVTLRSCVLTDGQLTVDLSEGYNGLSGIDLTLADSCIVLTLTQLEEVDRVYLTVEGEQRPFRDSVLTAADFVLDNGT